MEVQEERDMGKVGAAFAAPFITGPARRACLSADRPGGAEGKQLRSIPAPNRRLKRKAVLPGCSPAQAAAGPSKAAQRRSASRAPGGPPSDPLPVTRLAPLASDKPASSYIARLSPRRPAAKAPPCPCPSRAQRRSGLQDGGCAARLT